MPDLIRHPNLVLTREEGERIFISLEEGTTPEELFAAFAQPLEIVVSRISAHRIRKVRLAIRAPRVFRILRKEIQLKLNRAKTV